MALLLAALAFHGWKTLALFPSLRALVDDRPVVMVDHAIHEYHGALGARFARRHGTTWGFDPFFMAGYPETPVWDSSSNLAIAFQFAAGGYDPSAYKVGLVFCALIAWGAVPAGARVSGLSWGEASAAGAVALVAFWALMPAMFWRSGLFAFVTAAGALPLLLGLALGFGRGPGPWRWLVLASAGAAWLFAHVTAPVMLAGGAIGFASAHAGRARRRVLAAAIGAAALAVLPNLVWLGPLWAFRGIRAPQVLYMTFGDPWELATFYRDNPLDGHVGLALLVLGLAGLGLWWREGAPTRPRAATFTAAAAGLLGLTAFGGLWWATRTLEPFRFLAALDLLLCVPVGSLLARGAGALARRAGGSARGLAAVAAAAAALVGLAALADPPAARAVARKLAAARPLAVGLRPEDRALVDWLARETGPDARILLEDQLRLLEPTDPESTHWTPLLPVLLAKAGRPRTFIGGLYQTAFIAHHRAAAFGDYVLGDRRIDAWPDEDLAAYCDRYNVGWVVCWSPLSRFVFDRFPIARRLGALPRPVTPGREVVRDATQWQAIAALAGPEVATRYLTEGVNRYALYRVERPRSFLLEGRGRITSFDFNRVELADLAPDPATGAVTLSLHWLDTWRTDPPLRLEPLPVTGDPVPFVRLRLGGPARRVVLFNGYGRASGP